MRCTKPESAEGVRSSAMDNLPMVTPLRFYSMNNRAPCAPEGNGAVAMAA